MMISPISFINERKNLSYEELLLERDKLIEDIRAFENHSYDPELDLIQPSPDVVYQCNLEYLGILCDLISKKYNQKCAMQDEDD